MNQDMSMQELYQLLQAAKRPTRQALQGLRGNTNTHDVSSGEAPQPPKKEQKEQKILKKKLVIQCEQCSIADDSICGDCKSKQERKDCCAVCQRQWKKNQNDKSIQCDECKMWIHKKCDQIFITDSSLFQQYRRDKELKYSCPLCRQLLKVAILSQMIRYLTYFDEKLLWQLDPNSAKYFEVIKNPIDFDTIHKRNREGRYLENQDLLYQDVKLLLSNFLEFNLPNQKTQRKGCILKILYELLFKCFPHIKDMDLLQNKYRFHLRICEYVQFAFKRFLNSAFGGNNLVQLEGVSTFVPLWEPQLYSISPPGELRVSKCPLIQWEKEINPNLEFQNADEPLIKLNMKDFLAQQAQQEIKIKIDISILSVRHPYLDYLLKLESPQQYDDSVNSPQLQYSIKEMLTKELSTVNVAQQITLKVQRPHLMVEYLCCACGGYEHLNNLLLCACCHKTFHFYCQIGNAQYHVQRVLMSMQHWVCNNCVKCKTCNNFGSNLFCSVCNSPYHFTCAFQNFVAPTEGLDFWRCPDCFKCLGCQSTILYDINRLSKLKPSTTSNTLHISVEYFQNFQYCLQCGLDAAGYRFCEYCEEYIPIEPEEMSVAAPIQIECGSLYQMFFEEVNSTQRVYLNKENKTIRQAKQCVKCKQFYHLVCLLKNKKTINEEGICSDCSQDMSTLLFKIEKLKEQNIRRTIQTKSIKRVVPVVSNFLEFGPTLSLQQQTFILDNLETLEPLVSNFLTYQHHIDDLKEELTHNRDIKDEYIDKLTQYWCARFDWLEQPKQLFTNAQLKRQEQISSHLDNDYYDRLLLIDFFKQKKQYSIVSIQTLMGQYNTLYSLKPLNQLALDTTCLMSELQCCYVENLQSDPHFQFVDNNYYTNYLQILKFYERFPYNRMQWALSQKQQLLFLPIPNSIVRSIKKILGSQMMEFKKQLSKDMLLIQKGCLKIQTNQLKQNVRQLNERFTDAQITEKLKNYQQYQRQIRSCIKEISALYESKFQEAKLKLIEQQEMQQKSIVKHVEEKIELPKQQIPPQNMEDKLISSPLENIPCSLCKVEGNRSVSGRLLYVDEVRWVHSNCVIWNEDCRENELCVKQLLKNNTLKCEECSQVGSSIICSKCRKKCHFYCAYKAQWAFTQGKKVFCSTCFDFSEPCVTHFMNWRKITVQQKSDKKSKQAVYRFGNTILIALKPAEQRGHFEEINLLTLRKKMLYISLNMKEYTLRYAEIDKNTFLRECEKCEKNIAIFLQVVKLLMDKYTYVEYKVFNLEQLLQSFNDFDIQGMEFNENLGQFFMLYTPFIRQQLLDNKGTQKIINSVQFNSFREWFYQGIFVEDLPLDERVHQIQQLSRVIQESQINKETIYQNHPMLYDNIPKIEMIERQSSKLVRKDPQSKQVHITPNDILEEAGLITEECKQMDKQEELEKKLRHESKSQKQRNRLYVAPSLIHKYGLFTKQEFKKWDFVIEYTGEVIRNALADYRELTYNEQGFGDCYMFRASKNTVIDATFKGSEARFLNHSCQPNCASLLLDEKILIYAKKDIQTGEELTYDYQFEIEAESQKIQCRCGAKNCVGRLN